MNQKQVDVIRAQRAQCGVERAARVVRPVIPVVELAGDEHLTAVQAGIADPLADFLFIAVHLGGVDMPVPNLERRTHCGGGLIRFDLEDAETQLRDRVAVVERDRWDRTHVRDLLAIAVVAIVVVAARHCARPNSACETTLRRLSTDVASLAELFSPAR